MGRRGRSTERRITTVTGGTEEEAETGLDSGATGGVGVLALSARFVLMFWYISCSSPYNYPVTPTLHTHRHQRVAHVQRVHDLRALREHGELALTLLRDAPIHTPDLVVVHVREVLVEPRRRRVHALQNADLGQARDQHHRHELGVAERREVQLLRREHGGLCERQVVALEALDDCVDAGIDPLGVRVDGVVVLQVYGSAQNRGKYWNSRVCWCSSSAPFPPSPGSSGTTCTS